MERSLIDKNTVALMLAGSHAYGTNIEGSDVDFRGIAIMSDPRYYLGFNSHFEQYSELEPEDITIFNIQKAFNLMAKCNPNMLELLFTERSLYKKITPYWEMVLEHRDKFISKKAKHTYTGYAFSQLAKIKSSRRRLEDLNFKSTKQNEKRAHLEETYGYDCKHAMHLVRLMRMGKEILETGEVNVYREDKEELLSIRNGAWTYEQLEKYAEQMQNDMDQLYETSSLPYENDIPFLDKLCSDVIQQYLADNG